MALLGLFLIIMVCFNKSSISRTLEFRINCFTQCYKLLGLYILVALVNSVFINTEVVFMFSNSEFASQQC